jgi:predicted ATPase/DNA-binding SARP family transcriptional activator
VIEINVLGPLEVVRGGEVVAFPGDRERAVLAVLASRAGEAVSADRLIERLWGDALPRNPLNALQAIVSRLRRALGSERIVLTRKPGYMLDTEACAIDARRFEDLVRQARQLGPDQSDRASELLTSALSLWRGTPFADLEYQDVVQEEVSRLEELRVGVLEDKLDADLAAGRRQRETVAQLEALVAAHPFRERLQAQLILALYRCGRQGEAITAYHEARRVLSEELGVDPGPELKKLYERVLYQDPALLATSEPRDATALTNLPSRITSFIGRDAEIEELTGLLEANRLVTVVGPGGSGKTSLAVEVGRGFDESFHDGVWLVELAPILNGDLVPVAIGNAAGWPEGAAAGSPAHALERLSTYLRTKHVLLIIDNCEHVVQTTAEVADALLKACPSVAILATSREVLTSEGEFVWTIPPLSVPSPDEDPRQLISYDAIRLLEQRAASAGSRTAVRGANAAAAAEICSRLDGMPLAIELAAARARSLSLREIADRLDQRFELLTSGGRTIEPRHRTLRAAIDWSYDLLSPEEQTLFRRLAVFSGGWTLDAAETVCVDGEASAIVDVLARLVDQSLVKWRDERFWMLETILSYARERLIVAGEADTMGERHAHFFRGFAEAAEPDLRSPDQGHALDRLRAEEHNLRLALQWCRDHTAEQPDAGLSLAAALGWYWYVGRQVEGRSELESMLTAAAGASAATRARALQAWSLALRPAGCIVHPSAEAAAAARESLSLFDAGDDPVRGALSRLMIAVEGVAGGDVRGYLEMVDRARSDLRAHEDVWGLALANFVEMEIRLYHDSPDPALRLGDRAAAQFDALDDDWGRSAVRLHLGIGLRLAGRTSEARQVLHEAVALSRDTGLPNNLARSLAELGEIATHIGDAQEAERWFDSCQEVVSDLADDALQALIFTGRADAARLRREPSLADEHYQGALALYDRNDVVRGQARALLGAAAAQIDLGNTTEARRQLDHAQRLVKGAADPAIHAASLEQRARLSLTEGGEEEARGLLRDAELVRTRSRRPRGALAAGDADMIAVFGDRLPH